MRKKSSGEPSCGSHRECRTMRCFAMLEYNKETNFYTTEDRSASMSDLDTFTRALYWSRMSPCQSFSRDRR